MKARGWWMVMLLFGSVSWLAAQDRTTDCEWCGAGEAPDSLQWTTTIAGPDEPGTRLVVSGRVVRADGRTPAAGVVMYLYHTNASGIYPKRGQEQGNGRRHGYLRSWLKTDPNGRYEFRTIRPAAYPGATEPAHIHVTVKAPGQNERWLDDFVFDDDPLLTPDRRRRMERRGGSGILKPVVGRDGILRAERSIVLPE